MSVDSIHNTMLSGIPDSYQKTVGFPIWDLTRAFAIGADEIDVQLQVEAAKLDVDNLTGDDLTRFVAQYRGIDRRAATRAKGILTVTGTGTVPAGAIFESTGGVRFRAAETVEVVGSGTVAIEAVALGAAGNVPAACITELPVTIQGIVSVTNDAPTTDGYDEEDDDTLRDRYYTNVREPPTSGNKAHYKAWALDVAGVGGVKVFPLARGDWTVDVVIVDTERKPADDALVSRVQAYIDPGSTGLGEGQAPIGAHCYVERAQGLPVALTLTVMLASGYEAASVTEAVSAAVSAYLSDIAFVQDYVSYAKIGSAINDVPGVLDFRDLLVGGGVANIPVGARQVAVLGEVQVDVEQ